MEAVATDPLWTVMRRCQILYADVMDAEGDEIIEMKGS